jgi:glucokinase
MGLRAQALVVDVGGTNLRIAVADGAGEVNGFRTTPIRGFRDGLTPAAIMEWLVGEVAVYHDAHAFDPNAPVVVSFPGPVERRRIVLAAPTLAGPQAELPDLYAMLSAALGRQVVIINDVSAAAWGLSATVVATRFMVLTVSSGIGSKIFDRRVGVLDDWSYAGEIGHQRVDWTPDAPLCDCGGRGHLGALSSGRGIERAARRRAAQDPGFAKSACAHTYRATAATLTNEAHLVSAARDGDRWALGVIREGVRVLASSLLAAVLAAGVERVVVIGGFAQELGRVYLDILRNELAAATDRGPLVPDPEQLVQLAEPGDQVCLKGAAVYAARVRKGDL